MNKPAQQHGDVGGGHNAEHERLADGERMREKEKREAATTAHHNMIWSEERWEITEASKCTFRCRKSR